MARCANANGSFIWFYGCAGHHGHAIRIFVGCQRRVLKHDVNVEVDLLQVRKWRRQLHFWDPKAEQDEIKIEVRRSVAHRLVHANGRHEAGSSRIPA